MNSQVILVVDDEDAVRMYVADVLRAAGFTVLEAAGAKTTLEVAARSPRPIDVLLTDVMLPGTDGIDLARLVRWLRPDIRILYMSGAPEAQLAARGLGTGSGFLRKPFGPALLVERVRQLGRVDAATLTC